MVLNARLNQPSKSSLKTTKRLWLENPLYHHKIDLLDAILDALGTNRPTNQVAQHFTQKIQ